MKIYTEEPHELDPMSFDRYHDKFHAVDISFINTLFVSHRAVTVNLQEFSFVALV